MFKTNGCLCRVRSVTSGIQVTGCWDQRAPVWLVGTSRCSGVGTTLSGLVRWSSQWRQPPHPPSQGSALEDAARVQWPGLGPALEGWPAPVARLTGHVCLPSPLYLSFPEGFVKAVTLPVAKNNPRGSVKSQLSQRGLFHL